jgi:pimeloyl-ACP methyl ester carboxylesterase
MLEPPVTTRPINYERHLVRTDDGVDLVVQTTGSGPPVLLGNGIGVTVPGLDMLVHQLRDNYRCILWDYRGIGGSSAPKSWHAYTMERHAVDAQQVLQHLGIARAAVFGWSMGVQVGLELIRRDPDRVAAFGALFGASGRPFHAAFPSPLAAFVHLLVYYSSAAPWAGKGIMRLGAAVPPLAWTVCSTARFVGRHADKGIFYRDVLCTSHNDGRRYFRTMAELMHHDASDMLGDIRCPVLVACGTQDWVTPPSAAKDMADAIPGATYLCLEDTSHFGVIEHGPLLLDPIYELLESAFSSAARRA